MNRVSQILLFIILSSLPLVQLQSQVYTGDDTLSTQAEVDNFFYTEVSGNLTIDGNISDVSPLSNLTVVSGTLKFRNLTQNTSMNTLSSLASIGGDLIFDGVVMDTIDGFPALQSVGGDIVIESGWNLRVIDGFPLLDSVGGSLYIPENSLLEKLWGFPLLDSIPGDLIIQQNFELLEIDAFYSLQWVGGTLNLRGNFVLGQINGLTNLNQIEGDFDLQYGSGLKNLEAFSGLHTINQNLWISFADSLTSLDGLSSLTSIGGLLFIVENPRLTNLDGLSNLTSIGSVAAIGTNPMLSDIGGLSNLGLVGGSLAINENPLLDEFCGLYELLTTPGGIGGTFRALENAANPDSAAIIAAGPCATVCSGNPEILDDDLSADPILLQASGSLVSIGGSFLATCASHTVTIDWGDETAANSFTTATVDESNQTYNSSYTYTQTGVYIVEITITDDAGNSSTYTTENNVLIYNPICGSARMAAQYIDPVDGETYRVFTRAAYASASQLTPRSGFTFYQRGSHGQNLFFFKATDINALVISGNTATITGQGRFKTPGSPWGQTPTHSFTVSFQDVSQSGYGDQILSLVITDLNSSNPAYDLGAPVNVQGSRVRVNNYANCRMGTPLPSEVELEQVALDISPNPFSSALQLSFQLAEESAVSVQMLDLQGRAIRSEELGTQAAGKHSLKWNATTSSGQSIAAGIYLVKLTIGEQSLVQRVVYRPN